MIYKDIDDFGNNKTVLNEIKKYIDSTFNPEYSILINGVWGSGKTYILRSFYDFLKEKDEYKNRILFFSLYGAETETDISSRIFYSNNRLLGSDAAQSLGKLFGNFTDNNIGINLDPKIALGLFSSNWFKSKNKILFVDDVERSNIPISLLFGYFHDLIIEHNVRVVFIASEDVLKEKDASNSGIIGYFEAKEKMIGRTYEIKSSAFEVLDIFVSDLGNFGFDKKEVVSLALSINSDLENKNLRILRQALISTQELVTEVIEFANYNRNIHSEEELMKDYLQAIVETGLVLQIQSLKNEFRCISNEDNFDDEVTLAISGFKKDRLTYKATKEEAKKRKRELELDLPYNAISYRYWGFLPLMNGEESLESFWSNWIKTYEVNLDSLSEYVRNDRTFYSPEEVSDYHLKILQGHLDMSVNEFDSCITGIIESVKEKKYTELSEIVHSYYILKYFIENDIISNCEMRYVDNIFDELINNGTLNHFSSEEEDNFGVLVYQNHPVIGDIRSTDEFYVKAINRFRQLKKEYLIAKFQKCFNEIDNEDSFLEWVYMLKSSKNNEYAGLDLLNYIDPQETYLKFADFKISTKSKFSRTVMRRRQAVANSVDESTFICGFKEVLSERYISCEKSIESLWLKHLIEYWKGIQ